MSEEIVEQLKTLNGTMEAAWAFLVAMLLILLVALIIALIFLVSYLVQEGRRKSENKYKQELRPMLKQQKMKKENIWDKEQRNEKDEK